MFELTWLPVVGVVIVIATSFSLLASPGWQASLMLLAGQYLGVFILVGAALPIELALVKLVSGWMAAAVLGMSLSGMRARGELAGGSFYPSNGSAQAPGSGALQSISGRVFRLLTGLLAAMGGLSITSQLTSWVPGLSNEQAWGSSILLGIGLLQLGFTIQPLRTILGLLSFLAGFEIIYAAAEPSTLVTGLLAIVTLGLSLVGAYLLLAPSLEENA